MSDDPYETFPHQKLPMQVNRRQFMRNLVNELRTVRAGRTDHPALRLCDLGEMPDAELSRIVPVLTPGSEIIYRDQFVYGRCESFASATRLFPFDSPDAFILRLFNGERTIADISRELAQRMGWEEGRAFSSVRGVFLQLVMDKMIMPKSI